VKSIDIIVPAYDEETCIEPFYRRLSAVISDLPYRIRVIFVDDGSRDRTGEICARLAETDPRVGFIRFSRNFGHQAALTAGIDMSRADAVITIDADLQNPPEKLPEFIRAWEEGADIVSGVRSESVDASLFKRTTSSLFYRLLNLISPLRIPADSPDFQLLDAKVAEAISRVREQGRFLRGIYSWVGFRRHEIPYTHAGRAFGSSKYNVGSMVRLARRAVLGFSRMPLRLSTYLGLLVTFSSFVFCAVALVRQLAYSASISGWSWLAILISFLAGMQLLAIGVLGEYVAQVLEESRRRPLYVIADSQVPSYIEDAAVRSRPVELARS
jgi:dolichol-phosphate mannosyltransferase